MPAHTVLFLFLFWNRFISSIASLQPHTAPIGFAVLSGSSIRAFAGATFLASGSPVSTVLGLPDRVIVENVRSSFSHQFASFSKPAWFSRFRISSLPSSRDLVNSPSTTTSFWLSIDRAEADRRDSKWPNPYDPRTILVIVGLSGVTTDIKMRIWLRNFVTRCIAICPSLFVAIIEGTAGSGRLIIIASMILSFELSFVLVPLLKFSSSTTKMGHHKNSIYHELCDLDNPQQLPEACDGLDWGHGLSCDGLLYQKACAVDISSSVFDDHKIIRGGELYEAPCSRGDEGLFVPRMQGNIATGDVISLLGTCHTAQLISAFSTGALKEDITFVVNVLARAWLRIVRGVAHQHRSGLSLRNLQILTLTLLAMRFHRMCWANQAPSSMESLYWPPAKALQSQAQTLINRLCSLFVAIIGGTAGLGRLIIIASMILSFKLPLALSLSSSAAAPPRWGPHKNSIYIIVVSWVLGLGVIGINFYHELCHLDNPHQLPEACDGLDWGRGLISWKTWGCFGQCLPYCNGAGSPAKLATFLASGSPVSTVLGLPDRVIVENDACGYFLLESDFALFVALLINITVAPSVMESLYWPLAKALQSQARTLTNISCRHRNENMVAKPCDSMHRNLSQPFRSHYWRNNRIREAYNHSIGNCGLMGPWLGCDWDECLLLEHELCDLDNPQQLPETCDGLDWGHGLSCYGILRDLFNLLDVQEGQDDDLRLEVGGFDGAGRARSQRRMQIGLALPPQNEIRKLELCISVLVFLMTACYFGEVSSVKLPAAEVMKACLSQDCRAILPPEMPFPSWALAQLVSAFSTGALREDATKTLTFAGTTCFCIQHWFLLESSFALFVALLINLAVVSVSGTLCATTDLYAEDSNRCSDLT
ncbi:hypothetical protein ZIOFF_033981 [Zingiber officinale]|uniref:Uncharacterized protein n=1 Tax=Zingiber officinale TaxID=94328 RepID=A0A8J5GRJ3_ZINOF|nr:hypothetical protein ZIOFF_033981 [Zingiber officinale]